MVKTTREGVWKGWAGSPRNIQGLAEDEKSEKGQKKRQERRESWQ